MTNKNLKFSVLSTFYIAIVLHGLQRMSGFFIIELSKGAKDITSQEATIPFIYSWAVAKIVASFSDFLIDNKCSQISVFCGILLCAIGTALCILDADITAITVFWGFIFGSGYGLASPHLTGDILNRDFNKLSFFKEVPSSFGIIIMPILLDIIILQYGLKGSFIIFSGLIIQFIPFSLAAAYNIEIRFPNIKWRVRKKNNQYSVSKQESKKVISIENFNNSLEPDIVLNINQSNDYYHEINRNSPVIFSKKSFQVRRKRSETRGNDLQGLEADKKTLQTNRIYYPAIPEIENYNENGKNSQDDFSNTEIIDGGECKELKSFSIINSEIYNVSTLDKNIKIIAYDFDEKNTFFEGISENGIKEVGSLEEKLNDQCLRNNTSKDQKSFVPPCIQNMSLISGGEKDYDKYQVSENLGTEQRISSVSKQAENVVLTPNKFHQEIIRDKEPLVQSLKSTSTPIFNIPLDIKVHVEEYTFAVNREYRSSSFDSNYSGGSINYSQSRFLQGDEYFDSGRQNAPRNLLKDIKDKASLSNTYSVSNKPKYHSKKNPDKGNETRLNMVKDEFNLKCIRMLKFFSKITSPVCLCIIVVTIIFEISLITLLTNSSDFMDNTNRACYDFMWILVAFGIGGLFGKLCCCKISKTISEKSHTAGIVLFLLTGLSIAGVLYSPNFNWLAGFYSILGALEGGISYILPNFISNYTHKEVHHVISSMKNFLSGVTLICLPSVLRLLPDEMSDYEFLLQTLSCLSVLCALVAYFLPYLRNISDKRNIQSFHYKMNRL